MLTKISVINLERLDEPYTITYPQITAVANKEGTCIELIEFFDCVGGAMWAMHHYAQSPLVKGVRNVGGTMRYFLRPGSVNLDLTGSKFPAGISQVTVTDDEIGIEYIGMGGGGVGASICRALAKGVIRGRYDQSGGGKLAGSEVWLVRRERVLIGIDDTDTPDEGATWTLAHNIAKAVEDEESRYLSHTIVQLFPVPFKTKNCVSTVCEFASSHPEHLVQNFHDYLREYTLSPHTGMAVYRGFDPRKLLDFGRKVKKRQISFDAVDAIEDKNLTVHMHGRGKVGAVAALPFYCNFQEALDVWSG